MGRYCYCQFFCCFCSPQPKNSTFSNGEVADAEDLNGNFEALIQKIKILEERLSALGVNEGCQSLSSVGDGVLLGSSENLLT